MIRAAATTRRCRARSCRPCCMRCPRSGITRLMVEGGARVAASFVAGRSGRRSLAAARARSRSAHDGVPRWTALPLVGDHASRPRLVSRASEALGRRHSHDLRAQLNVHRHRHRHRRDRSLTPTAQGQLHRLRIACRYDQTTIADGASIACNGVCLTVVASGVADGRTWFDVDAAAETLAHDHGEALGGRHEAQSRTRAEDRRRTRRPHRGRPCRRHRRPSSRATICPTWRGSTLRTTRELARFIAAKGSVTLDGVSLTVNTVEDVAFSVLIIPHTLGVTTLGGWQRRQRGQYRSRPDGALRRAAVGNEVDAALGSDACA